MSEEDVEEFLWDLERELSHLDGEERRALVKEAEDRLHEIATRLAQREQADSVRWYHYVQASAEIGPPERLAAELTGEPLPEAGSRRRWLYAVAAGIVLVIAGLFGYAYLTTGDLDPIGSWSGEEQSAGDSRAFTFNITEDTDSVFVSFQIVPTNHEGTARVTILDGRNQLVYEATSTFEDHLETATFIEGAPGSWRLFVDFTGFTGSWSIEARAEQG